LPEDKIIQFPSANHNYENQEVESEDWETDYYYYDRQDWKGLVKLREKYAEQHQNNPYAQWRLGEAYILGGEFGKSLKLLSDLHYKYPDYLDVQYSLLDTLFALNKTEEDYNWINRPTVVRLDKDVVDACYTYLKGKRRTRTLNDFYCDYLILQGYIGFTKSDLYYALIADGRFIVEGNPDFPFSARVKAILKKKKVK
jgi:tetratricopeptide (TPR) repeat protein